MSNQKWQLRSGVKTPETLVKQIRDSDAFATVLALELGVSSEMVRRVRRAHGIKQKPGRRSLTLDSFPPNTDWNQSANKIAKDLGISWKIADRLRTEALNRRNYKPVIHAETPLPGFEGMRLIPESLDTVDWTENASMLSSHLGLDKQEVLRLKSLAHRQRRLK